MIVVGNEGDDKLQKFADKAELILVLRTVDCLQAVLNIIPMQELSYLKNFKKNNKLHVQHIYSFFFDLYYGRRTSHASSDYLLHPTAAE